MVKSPEKHLHVVSFDVPYPANYGGVIDVFYKLKALHNEGVKLHLHCFEYGREQAKELNKICHSVHYYKRHTSRNNLIRPRPFIVVTRDSEELLKNLLKDNHPILFEGLHTCFYLDEKKLKKRKKIVRSHNIEHDYYLNLARVERDVFKKTYFYNESFKLKRFEKVLKHADVILGISKNDTAYLSSKYKNCHLVTAFHPNEEVSVASGKGKFALYHGSMDVGENNEAALFLVDQVFNDIKVPLIIAGKKPSKELRDAVAKYKHIKLESDLTTDGIYDLVKKAQINVLPTFQATGIKLKLLAALFNGRHCLVNNFMVENTGLEKLCVVKNTSTDMKKAVVQLFEKPFDREDLAKREKILIKDFSNEESAKKLVKLIF